MSSADPEKNRPRGCPCFSVPSVVQRLAGGSIRFLRPDIRFFQLLDLAPQAPGNRFGGFEKALIDDGSQPLTAIRLQKFRVLRELGVGGRLKREKIVHQPGVCDD